MSINVDMTGDNLLVDGLTVGGVALTDTAAELNVLHGVVAGTVSASKAVVVDANKAVDTLDITSPKINGTAVTATATEINKLAGVTAGTVTASKAVVVDANKAVDTLTVTTPIESVTNAITAHAGGGQASAVALTTTVNRVTTVGSAADSVKLPAATAGKRVVVINAAASNAMTVYPASGEVINALTADTGLSVAANKTIVFYCAVAGTWNSVLTA